MKRILCTLMSITILVALFALFSLIVVEKRQQEEPGIIGTWETAVSILGMNVEEQGKTGTIAYRFDKNATGQLIPHVDREAEPEDFSYCLTESNLEIKFSDGTIWSFPYRLEGDTLTLTQGNFSATYVRVK